MLLPSAFDCAPRIHQSRSSCTPGPTLFSPPPTSTSHPCATSPVSSNIYSACRSLQSLITTNIPSAAPSVSCSHPQLASPIVLTAATSAHSKKQSRPQISSCATTVATPQTPKTSPRTSRKRRRSLNDHEAPSLDQEEFKPSKPSTPKRQCLYPPSIPLGLLPADFAALQEAAANISIPISPPNPSEVTNPSDSSQSEWTSPDDGALVSLILHKLRLRQSDFDECARRLGKGNGSIGERWKLLVREGEVGLRRG